MRKLWEVIADGISNLNEAVAGGRDILPANTLLGKLMQRMPVPIDELGTWGWIRRSKRPFGIALRYNAHDPDAGWPSFVMEAAYKDGELVTIRVSDADREVTGRALKQIHMELWNALNAPYDPRW